VERASGYPQAYARWRNDHEDFWSEAVRDIDWSEAPKRIFDPGAGIYGRWFADGVCNTCWNARAE
jgi:propionyl-CoA synthetase